MVQHAVLFDLDDTLLETHSLFKAAISDIKDLLMKDCNMSAEIVSKAFEDSFVRAYNEVSVNPVKKDPLTFKYVKEILNISDDTSEKCLDRLSQVYITAPDISDGAIEVLEYFKESKYRIGLVTHATEDWSNLKIDTHGLRRYFDHIEICDVNVHKGSENWKRAFNEIDVNPEYGMIIGDNIKGDIIAGHTIGVNRLIWINKAGAWTPYSTGEIPSTTVTVEKIKDVLPILKNKKY